MRTDLETRLRRVARIVRRCDAWLYLSKLAKGTIEKKLPHQLQVGDLVVLKPGKPPVKIVKVHDPMKGDFTVSYGGKTVDMLIPNRVLMVVGREPPTKRKWPF